MIYIGDLYLQKIKHTRYIEFNHFRHILGKNCQLSFDHNKKIRLFHFILEKSIILFNWKKLC